MAGHRMAGNREQGASGIRLKRVLSFGGAFMALIMGSGFASGQEVLRFFAAYGFPESLGGLALAFLILAGVGAKVMADGNRLQLPSSGSIYRYYCGKRLGKLFELLIPLLMFCFLTVMLSGAGATFQEYYGISGLLGRILMAGLAAATVLLGLSRLIKILGFLGIVIIITVTGMSIMGVVVALEGSVSTAELAFRGMIPGKATFSWWMAGILYGSMNVTTALPFLSGVGKEASGPGEAGMAGAFGGGAFMLGATAMNLSLLAQAGLVAGKQIPFLWVADSLSPVFGMVFSVILLGGIYTTAVPLLWSICDGMAEKEWVKNDRITVLIVIFLAFLGSAFPFATLVGTIYPATGCIGLLLLFCVFFK